MRMIKTTGIVLLFALSLTIPTSKAADPESVFPWKKGEVFTYRSAIEGEESYTEQGEIKKIKQKTGLSEYSVEIEASADDGAMKGAYNLDDKGNFLGCSASGQSNEDKSLLIRSNFSLKKNELSATTQFMVDGNQVGRVSKKFENVSEDSWIFFGNAVVSALRLALEPLELGYDKIHPFFVLYPVLEERTSGKLRLQVTGEDTIDFGGEKAPVYTLDMIAPKYPFTLESSDKDQVASFKLWVMKSNKKLVKFVSSDLETDVRLDP